jgi:hypothetical protein
MGGMEMPIPSPGQRHDTSKREKRQSRQDHRQMNMPGM